MTTRWRSPFLKVSPAAIPTRIASSGVIGYSLARPRMPSVPKSLRVVVKSAPSRKIRRWLVLARSDGDGGEIDGRGKAARGEAVRMAAVRTYVRRRCGSDFHAVELG